MEATYLKDFITKLETAKRGNFKLVWDYANRDTFFDLEDIISVEDNAEIHIVDSYNYDIFYISKRLQEVDNKKIVVFLFIMDLKDRTGDHLAVKSVIQDKESLDALVRKMITLLQESDEYHRFAVDFKNALS